MATHYLKIDKKEGNFFQTSKTPQEGFERNDWEVDGKTGTNYKKYFKEPITGEFIDVRYNPDGEYGDVLSFTLKDGEEYYIIQTNFEPITGRLDYFAEDFIKRLPNLVKGQVYTCNPFVYQPEDRDRPYRGISFWEGEERNKDAKIEKALTQQYIDKETGEPTEGDVPPVYFEQKRGKWIADSDEKIDYLFGILESRIAKDFTKQEEEKQEEKPTSKKANKSKPALAEVSEDEVDDDLPF